MTNIRKFQNSLTIVATGSALVASALSGCASSSSSSSSAAATSTAAPTITSVGPSSAPIWTRQVITITGTGFSTSYTAKVGDITCTSPTATTTSIICTLGQDTTSGAKMVKVYDGSTLVASLSAGITLKTDTYTTVATVAGAASHAGYKDGTTTAARFNGPAGGVIVSGILYLSDSSNHVIRKIDLSTGAVTVFAGTMGTAGSTDGTGTAAKFSNPQGLASDGTNLFVADSDNHLIRQIVISTGAVTSLAGKAGYGGYTNGTGTTARFYYPRGVTVDSGIVYVTDPTYNIIRAVVVSTGVVTTFAGTAGSSNDTDGTGSSARFRSPYGITNDATNLYIADAGASTIRKIVISTAAVTTVAGTAGTTGSTNGTGTAATFYAPQGIVYTGGNLYVADTSNNLIRQVVAATGVVTTVAGSGTAGIADGTGTSATFYDPVGLATDGTDLYISENRNSGVRKMVISTAAVTVYAGSTAGFAATYNDVDATGADARFRGINGIVSDGTNLYVSDTVNCNIRKVVISSGVVTTFAGKGPSNCASLDGTGVEASFNQPRGLATDGTNLYVADFAGHVIRKVVISSGVVTTLAGSGSGTVVDGTGVAASFYYPTGVALNSDNTALYVSEYYGADVRKIVLATGAVTSVAGVSMSIGYQDGVGTDPDTGAKFGYLTGIASDGTYLYVADSLYKTVRVIEIATGVVNTLAGTPGVSGGVNSIGTASRLKSPSGIAVDGGYVYVADQGNGAVRKIDLVTGAVTSAIGTIGYSQDVDGAVAGGVALLFSPQALAWDRTNGLFIGSMFNVRWAK